MAMDYTAALAGIQDPRGMQGILSRGNNAYPGGTNNAGHAGGRPATGQINPMIARKKLARTGMDPANPGAEMASQFPQTVNGLPGGVGSAPQGLLRAVTAPSSQALASFQRQQMLGGIPPTAARMMPMDMALAARRRLSLG